MQAEIKSERKKWKANALANRDATGAEEVDWDSENEKWKKKEEEIRKKYADKAIKIGDQSESRAVVDTDTKAVVDTETKANKIVPGPSTKNKGGVTVIDGGDGGAGTVGSSGGSGGQEDGDDAATFSSEDPNDASVLSSKSTYNLGG